MANESNQPFRQESQLQKQSITQPHQKRAVKCLNCGEMIGEDAELCPCCMHPVHGDRCSFCGGMLIKGDHFCPECGNSVDGVLCPKCGTLNFRNFCYKCHEPLTIHAHEETGRAEKDPLVLRMKALTAELIKLEELLPLSTSVIETTSKQDQELIESYRAMLKHEPVKVSEGSNPDIVPPQTEITELQKQQLVKEYQQKAQELAEVLKSFSPPTDTTPELQRDYYSARRIPILAKSEEKVTVGWICNYCGFRHLYPEQCVEPWRGGTWIYDNIVIEKDVWINEQ